MKKKLILIDLDDTLWDTWLNNKESLNEVYTALHWGRYFSSFECFFERYYYPVNHQLWERYNKQEISKEILSIERLCRPLSDRLVELQQANPLDETTLHLEQVVSRGEAYWVEANDDFMERIKTKKSLCPNALEVVAYLKSKYHICILSNGFGEVQYAKINNSGLSPYIDDIVLSDEVGYNKPNPRIFEHCLGLTGYDKAESIMIGDSWSSDIRGAALSGIDSIWYNRYHLDMPKEEITPPLAVVGDLAEIMNLL